MIESYLFTSSLKEFFRFKRVVWWLVIGIAVFAISWTFSHRLPKVSSQDAYILLSSTLVFRILPLCAAIYSMSVINQEVTQRTIVYLLTRPIPRWKLLVFRSLAAIIAVFVVTTIIDFGVFLAIGKGQTNLFTHDMMAILAGAAAYTSLFTLVSLFLNRPMIVCLLFSFVWETAIPNMPGDLYRLSVSGYLTSIAHRPVMEDHNGGLDALAGLLGVNVIPSIQAWLVVLGITVACLGFGSYWFNSFEYMAREDD